MCLANVARDRLIRRRTVRTIRLVGAPRPPPSAASGGRCEQSQLASAVDRLGAAVHAELGVDVAHVRLDRAERQVELAADLRGGEVARQEAEHAQLALAQLLAQ